MTFIAVSAFGFPDRPSSVTAFQVCSQRHKFKTVCTKPSKKDMVTVHYNFFFLFS
jgi:hypothetical protein